MSARDRGGGSQPLLGTRWRRFEGVRSGPCDIGVTLPSSNAMHSGGPPCCNILLFLGDISQPLHLHREGAYRHLPVSIDECSQRVANRLHVPVFAVCHDEMVDGFARYKSFEDGRGCDRMQEIVELICTLDEFVSKCSICIAGFSRGCVVLNRLLADFQLTNGDRARFWDAVGGLYWLDACQFPIPHPIPRGKFDAPCARMHSEMGVDAYCFTSSSMRSFCAFVEYARHRQKAGVYASRAEAFPFVLSVQSTPRQLEDPDRPMIAAAKKEFVTLLREEGVHFRDDLYFRGLKGCLSMHFALLDEFRLHVGSHTHTTA